MLNLLTNPLCAIPSSLVFVQYLLSKNKVNKPRINIKEEEKPITKLTQNDTDDNNKINKPLLENIVPKKDDLLLKSIENDIDSIDISKFQTLLNNINSNTKNNSRSNKIIVQSQLPTKQNKLLLKKEIDNIIINNNDILLLLNDKYNNELNDNYSNESNKFPDTITINGKFSDISKNRINYHLRNNIAKFNNNLKAILSTLDNINWISNNDFTELVNHNPPILPKSLNFPNNETKKFILEQINIDFDFNEINKIMNIRKEIINKSYSFDSKIIHKTLLDNIDSIRNQIINNLNELNKLINDIIWFDNDKLLKIQNNFINLSENNFINAKNLNKTRFKNNFKINYNNLVSKEYLSLEEYFELSLIID